MSPPVLTPQLVPLLCSHQTDMNSLLRSRVIDFEKEVNMKQFNLTIVFQKICSKHLKKNMMHDLESKKITLG